MADSIIITGDLLRVAMPLMGATVFPVAAPVPLIGSGARVNGLMRPVCVQGDELPAFLKGVPLPYVAPPYVIPGTGTLQILLMPTNLAKRTMNAGKPLLLKGGQFQAKFQVASPAMFQPPGPVPPQPDPISVKIGPAQFITSNMTVRAS
jgi:Contractile injection system spike tip protein